MHPFRTNIAGFLLCLAAFGCGDSTTPSGPPPSNSGTTLSAGGHHACRITADGLALCWGRADAGQIGADSTPVTSAPTVVPVGDVRFASIVAGGLHTCALTPDGEPWCWGQNDAGQTGVPVSMNQVCGDPIHGWQCIPHAQAVATSLRFDALVAGGSNTCGFGTDGGTYCWGSNRSGQLGAITELCAGTPCSASPVALPAQPKLRVVAAGSGNHLCGLTAEGAAFCWGANDFGQLGIGTVGDNRSVPTPVTGGTKFKSIVVGGQHTCALAADGKPWCWGADILPPGVGGVSRSAIPVAVSDSPVFTDLITGTWAACGRTSVGTVFCWGINAYGEMGISPAGLTTRYPTPQPMLSALHWSAIAGSHGTFCGLDEDAQTWCWGFGDYGELGPAVQTESTVPVRIDGI